MPTINLISNEELEVINEKKEIVRKEDLLKQKAYIDEMLACFDK